MADSSYLVGGAPSKLSAEGNRTELPELSESAKLKLSLQWDELIEKHHFDGEHSTGHEKERARRRTLLAQSRSEPLGLQEGGPLRAPSRGMSSSGAIYDPSYPDAVDPVGIGETVSLARARFDQLRLAYLPLWAVSQDARVEEFSAQLILMGAVVVDQNCAAVDTPNRMALKVVSTRVPQKTL